MEARQTSCHIQERSTALLGTWRPDPARWPHLYGDPYRSWPVINLALSIDTLTMVFPERRVVSRQDSDYRT